MGPIAVSRIKPESQRVPENSRVVLVNTPYSFVGRYICPNQVSVGELQLLAHLKARNNDVTFVNMRSDETHPWRSKRAGREGTHHLAMGLLGKQPWYLAHRLAELRYPPDEIWITCSFTCDAEVLAALVSVCRQVWPKTPIVVGGKAVRVAPELADELEVEAFPGRIDAADLTSPDFSVLESPGYGLFKLEIGCPHGCSFCVAALDRPRALLLKDLVQYAPSAAPL